MVTAWLIGKCFVSEISFHGIESSSSQSVNCDIVRGKVVPVGMVRRWLQCMLGLVGVAFGERRLDLVHGDKKVWGAVGQVLLLRDSDS